MDSVLSCKRRNTLRAPQCEHPETEKKLWMAIRESTNTSSCKRDLRFFPSHFVCLCVSQSLSGHLSIHPSRSLSALSLYLLQEGMTYCAKDVQATFEVFQEVFPKMMEHAAHPCSLAGVLQMGSCYLPVDTSWQRYINRVRDVCG